MKLRAVGAQHWGEMNKQTWHPRKFEKATLMSIRILWQLTGIDFPDNYPSKMSNISKVATRYYMTAV